MCVSVEEKRDYLTGNGISSENDDGVNAGPES